MKLKLIKYLVSVLFCFALLISIKAQRGFKYCRDINIEDYDYMGQSAFAWLTPGDTAVHKIVLYSNQAYKIFVCGPKRLGQINFAAYEQIKKRITVKDKNGNEKTDFVTEDVLLFDSEKNPEGLNYWLIEKNDKTRRILIRVCLADSEKNIEDAVDILVGRKPIDKKRFNRPRGHQW